MTRHLEETEGIQCSLGGGEVKGGFLEEVTLRGREAVSQWRDRGVG